MHDCYPDILKRARDRAFKETNSTNIANIKGHGPKAMKVDVWNDLVDQWLDSKLQNKFVAGQKNRAAMPADKLHIAGSISISIVKPISQADINEAIKEAFPSAINTVLPGVVNEAIQSNLLFLLSKILGFPKENNPKLGKVNEKGPLE
ncbi:hypothetical protein Ahy_B01g052912 [Arachis hypogaea]|uniref:Uncharacterized protein n=1 Tax=Arachis hypogaea TaxID=3818 RepID=A0A445AQR1_ARAHY|nr:hypothetical protein Ahy_B01g052912 [Arachis hypogaea]